jgi:hypothetical protein
MKNLFKKSVKKETKSSIQKIDKNQLEKVVGGVDAVESTGIKKSKITFGGGTT